MDVCAVQTPVNLKIPVIKEWVSILFEYVPWSVDMLWSIFINIKLGGKSRSINQFKAQLKREVVQIANEIFTIHVYKSEFCEWFLYF